jgi:hypothetical protein
LIIDDSFQSIGSLLISGDDLLLFSGEPYNRQSFVPFVPFVVSGWWFALRGVEK